MIVLACMGCLKQIPHSNTNNISCDLLDEVSLNCDHFVQEYMKRVRNPAYIYDSSKYRIITGIKLYNRRASYGIYIDSINILSELIFLSPLECKVRYSLIVFQSFFDNGMFFDIDYKILNNGFLMQEDRKYAYNRMLLDIYFEFYLYFVTLDVDNFFIISI